jgi:hypothetical protein
MVLNTKNMEGLIPSTLNKKVKNMKYLILSNTVANKQKVKAGDVVELNPDEGTSLVGYGKAEIYKEKEKKETNRSVGLKKSNNEKLKTRSK